MNRQSTEGFYGHENTLYDTIMVDTCHYTFAHIHRMYTIKSEPQGKLPLYTPTVNPKLTMGEAVSVYMGTGINGKSLYLLLHFAMNLKLF